MGRQKRCGITGFCRLGQTLSRNDRGFPWFSGLGWPQARGNAKITVIYCGRRPGRLAQAPKVPRNCRFLQGGESPGMQATVIYRGFRRALHRPRFAPKDLLCFGGAMGAMLTVQGRRKPGCWGQPTRLTQVLDTPLGAAHNPPPIESERSCVGSSGNGAHRPRAEKRPICPLP